MAKPTKVRYSGMGVYGNEHLMSRVQNITLDVDLSEEEVRELTNAEVVEFLSQTPAVTASIEANEYGSCRNLRIMASVTGQENITVNTFDGPSVDVGVLVEEDNVLKRSVVMNECFITSLAWNFDVGGIATETFNLETDNQTWYINTYKQTYSFDGISSLYQGLLGPNVTGVTVGLLWATATDTYTPVKVYVDGIAVTGTVSMQQDGSYTRVTWAQETAVASGTRWRVLMANTGSTATTIPEAPSTSAIGGITRGMIDINMVTGGSAFGSEGTTNLLRLQSCSIDADMSREVLNELGHFRAFARSLTLPVNVNITFSALASDLEEWAKFQTIDWGSDGSGIGNSLGIDSFTKTAALEIRIFDARDTEAVRNLKKSITITGMQVTAQSLGVDVGGNATQDYTAKASNFTVSGLGIPSDTDA